MLLLLLSSLSACFHLVWSWPQCTCKPPELSHLLLPSSHYPRLISLISCIPSFTFETSHSTLTPSHQFLRPIPHADLQGLQPLASNVKVHPHPIPVNRSFTGSTHLQVFTLNAGAIPLPFIPNLHFARLQLATNVVAIFLSEPSTAKP
jgi:hypothetical protein